MKNIDKNTFDAIVLFNNIATVAAQADVFSAATLEEAALNLRDAISREDDEVTREFMRAAADFLGKKARETEDYEFNRDKIKTTLSPVVKI